MTPFRLQIELQFELLWQKGPLTEPRSTDCGPLRAALDDLKAQIAKVEHFLNEPRPGEHNPPKPEANPAWVTLNNRIAHATSLLTACASSNVTSALTLSLVDKTVIVYLKHWHLWTSGDPTEKLRDKDGREGAGGLSDRAADGTCGGAAHRPVGTPQGGLQFLLAPASADRPPFDKGTVEFRRGAFETMLNKFVETALA